jgi:hypothetical protein
MNGPARLRDGTGPASVLLRGADLKVPNAARRRALAFTTAATGMLTGGTALAATGTSLAKSVVLWLCLGTVGTGVIALAVAQTVARGEVARQAAQAPMPKRSATPAKPPPRPLAPAPELPDEVAPAPVSTPAPERTLTRDARPTSPRSSRPAAAAPPSTAMPPATGLVEEQRRIESARAAVARGDASSALAILDDYRRAFPEGQFGPEALALRIEAVRASGDLARASALAAEFERRYPHHPLVSRVRSAGRP